MTHRMRYLYVALALVACYSLLVPNRTHAQTWVDTRGNTWEIRNVRATTRVTRIAPGMYAQGGPGGTLTVSQKRDVAVSVGATGTINYAALSAALNFSVTATTSVQYEYSRPIPGGRTMGVQFYNIFQAYEYEVWMKPLLGRRAERVGGGTVLRPFGTSFVATLLR